MNTLPTTLAWCVLQVTLLAIFVALGCAAMRKGTPAIRALAIFTALVLVMFLTVVSFVPWPGWSVSRLSVRAVPEVPTPEVSRRQDSAPVRTEDAAQPEYATQPEVAGQPDIAVKASPEIETEGPETGAMHQPTSALLFWESLAAELRVPPADVPTATPRWTWPNVLALIMLVGMAIGLARLLAGLMIVRSYRAKSRPVADPKLLELRDLVQAELGCPRQINLLESDRLATAATVGWRKPLVLLPANWREWSDDERRAVLAHEIAHIQRDDFLTWVAAQGALVLHYYHPLVHWLCGRLRLEQELAADAAAAGVTGGQTAYLTILAAMALRQADRPVAWPARTFLPTRGTFMRRIEMLRDTKLGSATTSLGVRGGTVVVLVVAGVLISGLRGGEETPQAGIKLALVEEKAEPTATATSTAPTAITNPESTLLGLEYVPRDAIIVAACRPAALLARPEMSAVTKALRDRTDIESFLGIAVDQIEYLLALVLQEDQGAAEAVILRAKNPARLAEIIRANLPEATEQDYVGRKFFAATNGARTRRCYLPIDNRTVAFAGEPVLRRIIVANLTGGAARAKWASGWTDSGQTLGALMLNLEALRLTIQGMPGADTPGHPLVTLSPLWTKPETAIFTLNADGPFTLSGAIRSSGAQDAKQVYETLLAAATLTRNSLSQVRASAARGSDKEGAALLIGADLVESTLDALKVEFRDREVTMSTVLPERDAAAMGTLLVSAISNTRLATQQMTAKNNLKQIGLAMHNFHDVFKHFPPAVLYGASGNGKSKYPHSWRVALLPYLNHADLYQEYKFDEPWDSESNRKLLAQMPAVYRAPEGPVNATNTSYFVLVGAQATDRTGALMFGVDGFAEKKARDADRKSVAPAGRAASHLPATPFWLTAPDTVSKGAQINQMIDGTSNTFLVVEAKRDVPWTKPDDIPYAADKPLPELGGYRTGFLALFGDGRVELLSDKIDEKTLRALITMNDGVPVDLDEIVIRDGR